jgi:DNA-binding IclR family transcriptional regulator
MKSLDKVFDIMELVSSMEGKSVTPGMAAKSLNLNGATCVRFMKYLCERGYLEQISRREGYVAGPAGLTFTDRESKYSKIVDAAKQPIINLAHKLDTHINISIHYNAMRYLLYAYSAHTKKEFEGKRVLFESYVPTSRLLLAACTEEELTEIIRMIGMPGKSWNNINDKESLLKELAKTRKENCINFPYYWTNQWLVGGLVIAEGYPPAAIGFGIAGNDPSEALRLTRETVKEIENNLTYKEIFF